MKDTCFNKKVRIPNNRDEYDVTIQFPGGREWVLQYRNYEGDLKTGDGASVDILMDATRPVCNWRGVEMYPAQPKSKTEAHVRNADQLCVVFD